MLSAETTNLLIDTLAAQHNEQVDAYIAGLRTLSHRKDELAAVDDLRRTFVEAFAARYPTMSQFDIEWHANLAAWHGAVLVGQILRGEYDPGGAYALPAAEVA